MFKHNIIFGQLEILSMIFGIIQYPKNVFTKANKYVNFASLMRLRFDINLHLIRF